MAFNHQVKSLHIFNPDCDYALACDRDFYTPPEQIISLRKQLALTPVYYANEGDAILLLDNPEEKINDLPGYDVAVLKKIDIINWNEINIKKDQLINYKPVPWGWNRNIRRILLDSVGEMRELPNLEQIKIIRDLSHRRITKEFLSYMKPILSKDVEIPNEIKIPQEAISIFLKNKRCYFKAPWSSSGRGILLTDDLELKHVLPWVHGTIRRQGSVMVEKAYTRKLDFATEWNCLEGETRFLGFSVFNVSRRGKYHGNIKGSQNELETLIKNNSSEWSSVYLDYQKKAIDTFIAPFYSGPLGIDMLITDSGAIHPCVEINLRHTMGMLYLNL